MAKGQRARIQGVAAPESERVAPQKVWVLGVVGRGLGGGGANTNTFIGSANV